MRLRSYSNLVQFDTFLDRYRYLKLQGVVGESTFGFDRWINQHFYRSHAWRRVRDVVILRDEGCDLGVPGYGIHRGLLIHHMNPVGLDDIRLGRSWILDPEYLITTTQKTHNAIHYGDETLLPQMDTPRMPGDTRLW